MGSRQVVGRVVAMAMALIAVVAVTCGGVGRADAATSVAQATVGAAAAQAGVPYCWGGGGTTGPTHGDGNYAGAAPNCVDPTVVGFDCSGLSSYAVYQATGGQVLLPHQSAAQPAAAVAAGGTVVASESDLQPGDLVFFRTKTSSTISHVGVYAGVDASGNPAMWDASTAFWIYPDGVALRTLHDTESGTGGLVFVEGVRLQPITPKLTPLVPSRVLDTRYGIGAPTGQVAAGAVVNLQVTGRGGVPATAAAVVLNLTAVSPSSSGWVTAWPAGGDMPTASNLNFVAGQTVPNLLIVQVGAGGQVALSSSARTHLVADVTGYLPAGAAYAGMNPVRVADTRYGTGVPKATVPAGGTITVQVAGAKGVPADASAAVVNVTSVRSGAGGSVTAYPAGTPAPTATSVSYQAGQVIAGLSVVKLGNNGSITLRSTAATDVVVDLQGWVPQSADVTAMTPVRLVQAQPVAARGAVQIKVAGTGAIPANAAAVQVTLTAANPTQSGYLTVWPTGTQMPTASNLNYTAGGSISNSAIVKVGAGGTISVYASGATPVTIDASAWWAP